MSEHECAEAVRKLYPYLDGELDADMIAMVESHLRHCTPCLEAFDFEAELRKVVANRCAEKMPDGMHAKLMAMLDSVTSGAPDVAGVDPAGTGPVGAVPPQGSVPSLGEPAQGDLRLGGPEGMALE
jgi:mycothiol system anti-sigma-R factor